MPEPAELPTESVAGATVTNELSSETQPAKDNLDVKTHTNPFTASPTIESLQEPTADFDPHIGAKPFSPFYGHDDNNSSLEYLKNESTVAAQKYGSNDLESGVPSTPRKRSVDVHRDNRQSKLWTKKRRCDCFASLTKKQRLIVKLALGLLIVGTMIGIAMGITAAVGGGVWKSANVRGSFGR